MNNTIKKKIDTTLKFVYSDNNSLSVIFHNNELLMGVAGEFNKNLKELEKMTNSSLYSRGNSIMIKSDPQKNELIKNAIQFLTNQFINNGSIENKDLISSVDQFMIKEKVKNNNVTDIIKTPKKSIIPRSEKQKSYVRALRQSDIVISAGPAGTGKTFLAVAVGLTMLLEKKIERIILSRPAVEAGERLGFLPGDMKEKVDPYLRPLYDSLYDLFDFEKIQRMIEIGDIEIAPLAFMRGRTLKNSFAILDEAQLIKNPKAKITQTCLSIESKFRIALSGTPIENSAIDLWTIFRFLMPGLLGGRKEFEQNLIDDTEKAYLRIRKQVSPFVLRRLKKEVATELPPKLETELPCQLTDEQKKEYRKLTEGAMHEHGENLKKAFKTAPTHIFALLTRLRQACCDLALLPGREHLPSQGAKSDVLLEKLTDLSSSGAKVLVFSQFTSFLSIIRKRITLELPELSIVELNGSTRNRTQPVDKFENANDSVVMLASLKAAGLGVTLKSADYVFLMDPWWNPAVEEQAIDRAHRIGRIKPTFIYRLITKGTIEDRVRQLQLEKKDTFNQIIGELNTATGLTDHFKTLKELIELKD